MKIAIDYLLVFSHFWFATPQLVLQADWQEVWHSPHPPFFMLLFNVLFVKVFTFFMVFTLLIFYKLTQRSQNPTLPIVFAKIIS